MGRLCGCRSDEGNMGLVGGELCEGGLRGGKWE